MQKKISSPPLEKQDLHPRNLHRGPYDFKALIESCKELGPFVKLNAYGNESVDFADANAVKMLNKALLNHFYNITFWDIPDKYLCPPIPGRADYIHYMADLFESVSDKRKLKVLDIGMGANCIYPILGHMTYGWQFVGSEIDPIALKSAKAIVANNPDLSDYVECRQQLSSGKIFTNVIRKDELFDLTICNPPFHSSAEEALQGTRRKWKNLGFKKDAQNNLNFGGINKELWCEGGEAVFIDKMITESEKFSTQCLWFSTLVSKKERLSSICSALKKIKSKEVKTIEMKQGQKTNRIVAWTFFSEKERENWLSKK